MVQVKFVKAHPAFAYFAGNVGLVSEEKAAMLLKGGYAMPIPEEITGPVNTLPADLPARDILFEAGFDTVEKVKEAGDSITSVKGVGKATKKLIDKYLAE